MTRDELEKGMIGLFEKYEVLFKNIDHDKMDFLGWLHSFQTYDEIRKASQFMMVRFLRQLTIVHRLWAYHTPDQWATMFLISEDSLDVRTIKGHLRDLKLLWSKRPKPKRRPL